MPPRNVKPATDSTPTQLLTPMTLHSYTKQELASMYCPNANGENAMRTLNRWINLNGDLQRELRATHYNKWAKSFTSRQVELIVKYLGEP